jgi:hypothetical protein
MNVNDPNDDIWRRMGILFDLKQFVRSVILLGHHQIAREGLAKHSHLWGALLRVSIKGRVPRICGELLTR